MSEKQTGQVSKMLGVLVSHLSEFYELTTEEIQWVIQNPKKAIVLFIEAIRNRKHRIFSIWKTIDIGTGLQNVDDFCQAIADIGGKVFKWAKDIMGKSDFTVSQELTKLNLVKVSVADLDFPDGATLKKIYERAISIGLKLVPAEAGPQLRLQYTNQPIDEWLLMAMEPIKDSGGDPLIFHVQHDDDGLWLYARYGHPGLVWHSGRVFVFCK